MMPTLTATALPDFPAKAFDKADRNSDTIFYAEPRFVTHIDDSAIEVVTRLYRAHIRPGSDVLDLMGSWVSHLPDDVAYASVVGHGMNAAELAENPVYTRHFVQNLNENSALPLEDGSFDAVICCVSIQYLQDPVAVLVEVHRILRPGGVVIISFSNRCFPTKAVAIWQSIRQGQHQELVELYLDRAGFDDLESIVGVPPGLGVDPLWAVVGRR